MKRIAEESSTSNEVAVGYSVMEPAKKKRRRQPHAERTYPVAPTPISSVQKPRTIVNHSYRDFSKVPLDANLLDFLQDEEQMSFPQRLHGVLSDGANAGAIEWMPHGRCFRVSTPMWLDRQSVFRSKLECKNYQVFLTILNSYGFKHITKGKDRNCFYHEKFLRGIPHLTMYFEEPKNARRLIPDPANEPDFDAISAKYPIP
mmetsp:Transcript_10167/g.20994  ORF Transcript_10167/g.20994 Transcript_10167/m.20994 type:complete len:202 (-) Transcript_10167:114-719(-)|eukprot:CAMPEP_0172458382 /NCGR_PEP_ID=MMETSP1065-20121228/27328_1 /TAXON_ID=265537 /ORGANISM="Amphiprora paludosa, Strain CCMP125" /LENGTH=201 /DNA_ID=CAMNT_0013212613 /DNA_START=43 /DNA_END=648 /DNA_ORIENTATION=-